LEWSEREMTSESDFVLGFWFGIVVARTMGFQKDQVAVREHLRSVERGDLTLFPTPEEVRRLCIDLVEAQLGRPATEEYLEVVRAAERFDRERASVILRQPMWQRPSRTSSESADAAGA
jgi:hypothetical protein